MNRIGIEGRGESVWLAWFLNDAFGWNDDAYIGFGVVTLALVLLASPWKNIVTAKIRNTPAAAAMAAPFASFPTLSLTSAFASSISWRTSNAAFSETSATMSPSDFEASSGGVGP